MPVHVVILKLDDDDYRAFKEEMAIRKDRPLPDGESNEYGAHVGEIIRDLWEYREIAERRLNEERAAKAKEVAQ